MTLKHVDQEEWYPVFTWGGDYGVQAEFSEAEIARVNAAMEEFDACQNMLHERCRKAK